MSSNEGDQGDNLHPAPDELVYDATELTPQLEQVFRGLAGLATTVPISSTARSGPTRRPTHRNIGDASQGNTKAARGPGRHTAGRTLTQLGSGRHG
ncbi:MAG TPA: hypothetical protein VMM60_11615 [Ilumatobacter sp.]|nr:hypothetical protein [Ilumatobacter sp.]